MLDALPGSSAHRSSQPAPQQASRGQQPVVQQQHVWESGLHLLHYRLARLLFEAGARQQAPVAQDFQPDSR